MKYTIVLFVFTLVFALSMVLLRYAASKQQIRDRLDYAEGSDPGGAGSGGGRTMGLSDLIRRGGMYFEGLPWAKKMEGLLSQAGSSMRGSEFAFISLGVFLGSTLLLLVLTHGNPWVSLGGGFAAGLLPQAAVKQKIYKKQKLFDEQLPVALSLMANALRSGYSIMQAIDLVSKEMDYPLGPEFGLVLQELNLGISLEEALRKLVDRNKTANLDLTVTAILIQRQVGGNLAELLDIIAKTLRARSSMKGKIRTLTTQGKVSGWVLCLLPVLVGLAMYVLSQEYITYLLVHTKGKMILGIGIGLQITGILWMRKIINIDV